MGFVEGAVVRVGGFVEATLAEACVPGCSVTLVDRDGPRWSGAFGLADVRRRVPATPDTVYHLFSGTKLFTAVAVLQLAERGRLAIEDPVRRHLPESAVPPDVTLLHLLSHQSGLRESLRGLLAVSFAGEALPSSAEALAGFPIRRGRAPGRRVEYCNANYALLGEVVSRVAGVEYRDYIVSNVLAPLGMDVGFAYTETMRARAATGYIERWDPMRLALRWIAPEARAQLYASRVEGWVELREYQLRTSAIGGLIGSMPEMARFLRSQLAGGGGVLAEASVRRMQTMVARGKAGIESRFGIALGWKHGRVGERVFLNHEGGGAGFTSELRLYPDAGIGVALAMNMMRAPRTMRAAHRICEAVFAARDELAS